jgi:hypothetical protein
VWVEEELCVISCKYVACGLVIFIHVTGCSILSAQIELEPPHSLGKYHAVFKIFLISIVFTEMST